MKRRIAALGLGVALVAAAGADTPPAAGVVAAPLPLYVGPTPLSTGDFDRDGRDDLAIGVPREDLSGRPDAGAVHVLYGSSGGLSAQRSQFWSQESAGIPGILESGDAFGWATAAGDFDGDGYDDLAIGAPLETLVIDHAGVVIFGGCCLVDARMQAGAVNVLYGGRNGLTRARAQSWHQGKRGIKGKPQANDFFGAALAAGDFDGDGRDDLAIGAPGENKGAGVVHVLRGAPGGLTRIGDQLWLQDTKHVEDTSEKNDAFGSALAAGDLGYSSKEDDLAIGIPGEDVSLSYAPNGLKAGAVAVLYGQPSQGLSASSVPDLYLHQNVEGVEEVVEPNNGFGLALAIGDFGRSDRDDLAVGVPGETSRRGAVQVFYGASNGLALADDQLWQRAGGSSLATHRLKGESLPGDELGRSLAAADVNGFSQDDLAVGVPFADVTGVHDAGSVNVVFGGPAGLTTTGSVAVPEQVWSARSSDLYGFALAIGNFGASVAGAQVVLSAPDSTDARGVVHVVGRDGPAAADYQAWHQNSPGIADHWEAGDRFGGG